ncbi:hypothetical protein BGZ67_009942 [Mortierella alpina]|nr:hypothetical protein BGZ67_009942 [Mortierella alpina]
MKYTIVLAGVLAIVQAAPLISNGGKPIADSYIVILKDGNTAESFKTKFDDIAKRQNGRGRMPTIDRSYSAVSGFSVTVNQAALKELQAAEEIEYIEQDAIVTMYDVQSSPPSWGLPRVSQRTPVKKDDYLYNDAAGEGVTAYVIDTGVYIEHSEFKGRASWGANFVKGSADTDENGHGTHCAGTIGGTNYGVAKKVNIVGVKVLDAGGSGSTSGVVAGMDWVAKNAVAGKSVVSMSLGGGMSQAINAAADRLYAKNIPLIVAAGNDANVDACDGSPSGAKNAYTVAASDISDKTASFTSYGKCVEIFAPGVAITSSWIGGANAKNTISGTSMATPHVAGVAALYLSFNSLPTAQSVFDKLTSTATLDKISGNLKGSPNRLVFNGGA